MTTRADNLAALTWLIEAGADEAISEEPVNRFRPSVVAQATETRGNETPLPLRQTRVPPAPAQNAKAAAELVG